MNRIMFHWPLLLLLIGCTDRPTAPSPHESLQPSVYLAIDQQMASTAPNDYSVSAYAEAQGILVLGAVHTPNGGYLVAGSATLGEANDVHLILEFLDLGGIDVPMRIGYVALVSPLAAGSYTLTVTHQVDSGDAMYVAYPIQNHAIDIR